MSKEIKYGNRCIKIKVGSEKSGYQTYYGEITGVGASVDRNQDIKIEIKSKNGYENGFWKKGDYIYLSPAMSIRNDLSDKDSVNLYDFLDE